MNEKNDGSELIVRGDYLETLKRFHGYYQCPRDENGNFFGPLVGYAATYEEGLHFVGAEYYNFSRVDQWPAVLTFFAEEMVRKIEMYRIRPTVILGAPMAGLKLSQEVARLIGCRHIYPEKISVQAGEKGQRPIEEMILARYEINPDDRVLIGEELVNNLSSTAKLVKLVQNAGGIAIGIMSAINRSYPLREDGITIPIISVITKETPQYRQDDPLVNALVQAGNVIWKPKIKDWPMLQKVMEDYGMF